MENSIFKFEKNDTCRMNRAPLVRFLEHKFEETLLYYIRLKKGHCKNVISFLLL